MLDCAVGTVKSRCSRGRARLAELLAPRPARPTTRGNPDHAGRAEPHPTRAPVEPDRMPPAAPPAQTLIPPRTRRHPEEVTRCRRRRPDARGGGRHVRAARRRPPHRADARRRRRPARRGARRPPPSGRRRTRPPDRDRRTDLAARGGAGRATGCSWPPRPSSWSASALSQVDSTATAAPATPAPPPAPTAAAPARDAARRGGRRGRRRGPTRRLGGGPSRRALSVRRASASRSSEPRRAAAPTRCAARASEDGPDGVRRASPVPSSTSATGRAAWTPVRTGLPARVVLRAGRGTTASAGWLVFRPPQGDTQVVDLYLCGSDEPTRSITLPRRPERCRRRGGKIPRLRSVDCDVTAPDPPRRAWLHVRHTETPQRHHHRLRPVRLHRRALRRPRQPAARWSSRAR